MQKYLKHLPNLLLVIFLAAMLVQKWPLLMSNIKREGAKAPDFSAQTLTGTVYESIQDQGQKRVFVFWATWCAPCKVELARIQDLIDQQEIKAESVLAISSFEDERLLRKTALQKKYTFPIIADRSGSLSQAFAVQVTPTFIFKNAAGQMEWIGSGISPLLSMRVKNFLKD